MLLRGDIQTWGRGAGRSRIVEAIAAFAAVLATAFLVFAQNRQPLLFLPLLPMILATFRIGRFGAAFSVMILTLVGGYFTLRGTGPVALMQGDLGGRLQFLQFYLAITVLTVIPVAADLSRRRQIHDDLRDSEARYRLLTANSSEIVMNLDLDGCIRFVSPSVMALGGYEPGDLIGANALELIYPDERERVRQAILDAVKSPGRSFIVEYRAYRSDGVTTWAEAHTQGICDEEGAPTGLVSVIRDISHRKAVEPEERGRRHARKRACQNRS